MSRRHKGRPGKPAPTGVSAQAWCEWLQGPAEAPPPEPHAAAEACRAYLRAPGDPPAATGALAEALVRCLAEVGDAAPLQRLAEQGGKALAKAARRALHGLRRKGVDVGEARPTRPAPRPTRADAPTEDDRRATLTAPFGDGDRVLVFRFRGAGDRRLHAGVATISDHQGLRELELFLGNARLYQSMARQAAERVPAAAVPFEFAYHRLARAAAERRDLGKLVPEVWGACRSLLSTPPSTAPHPADDLAVGERPGADAWGPLWDRPEIQTWMPSQDLLQALAQRFQEVLGSELLVTEEQRIEQLGHALDEQVTALLAGPGRARWAERLQDAAWVAHAQRASKTAGQLLALRVELLEAEAPEHLPFFRQLVLRPFVPQLPPDLAATLAPGLAPEPTAAPGLAPAPRQEGPLLWTPDQGPDPTTRRGGGGSQGPAGTGGGLIVPGR